MPIEEEEEKGSETMKKAKITGHNRRSMSTLCTRRLSLSRPISLRSASVVQVRSAAGHRLRSLANRYCHSNWNVGEVCFVKLSTSTKAPRQHCTRVLLPEAMIIMAGHFPYQPCSQSFRRCRIVNTIDDLLSLTRNTLGNG